jgi:two-component system alkaline phosphatase synthesis response regulator PhoP
MIKVCIVEDEKSLAEMIQLNLELEGFQVTTFHNGSDAFKHAKEMAEFNLVILDVMLPEVSGLDICTEIRKFSSVPILFLSAKGTTEDRIAGLKHGGNDYLPKPFDLEELLLRVNVLTKQAFSNSSAEQSVLTIGNKNVYFEKFEVTDIAGNEIITLSKREIDLLKLFNAKEGQVISRDEILDVIWGKELYPTSRTIDNYILLFRKIFEKNPKEPVYFHSIRAVGYKFTNSSPH